MKYYEWISDNIRMPDGDCWYIDFPIGSYNGVWFSECKRIDDWNERLIATYPQCNFIHVDFQPCRYPVLSERFFTHLNAIAPGTIQFLPFRMQQADGSNEITGYGLGQILNRVDCLDKERTQVADGVWRAFPPPRQFSYPWRHLPPAPGGQRSSDIQGLRHICKTRGARGYQGDGRCSWVYWVSLH